MHKDTVQILHTVDYCENHEARISLFSNHAAAGELFPPAAEQCLHILFDIATAFSFGCFQALFGAGDVMLKVDE